MAEEKKQETLYSKENFYHALHIQESSGALKSKAGDDGKAIGPYQIWKPYFTDSKAAGKYPDIVEKVEGAKPVVDGYMKRHAKNDWSDSMTIDQVKKCARIHNGGPRGHTKQATVDYWNSFKTHLNKEKICKDNVACKD
eukprot:121275_1